MELERLHSVTFRFKPTRVVPKQQSLARTPPDDSFPCATALEPTWKSAENSKPEFTCGLVVSTPAAC